MVEIIKLAAALYTAGGNLKFAVAAALPSVLDMVLRPGAERRRDDFAERLADRIGRLEERQITIEELSRNEKFIDAVTQAWTVAARTHDERKREALLNAVTNAALPGGPGATEQQIFMQLLDRFTAAHLMMLEAFEDSTRWLSRRTGPHDRVRAPRLAAWVLSEVGVSPRFAEPIWSDLHQAGLVMPAQLDNGPEGQVPPKRTTPLGSDLLAFIKSPLP